MENVCVITDFEEIAATRKFEQVATPAGLEGYSIFLGGNFIFIQNPKHMTIRFHLPNFTSQMNPDMIHNWIERIKRLYPNF